MNVFQAQLHIYKKIAKWTQKTQHLLNVLVSSVNGASADERADVSAVIFALLIVYSGQILLCASLQRHLIFLQMT